MLRTPLLAFDEFAAWGADLEAPASASQENLADALERDRQKLRKRLTGALGGNAFRDALFIASPALEQAVNLWQREPESERARKTEPALVAYFSRAAARPTPFGLFAGCSTGTIGATTRLELESRDRYRRHSRLDMEYLCALAEAIQRDPVLRGELIYRPNSSLYEAGGRLHLVEASQEPGRRSYKLVAVDKSPYLEATLERAAAGASLLELVELLVDEEVSEPEAEVYLGELIESQLLVGDVEPLLTGEPPLERLMQTLASRPSTAALAEQLADAAHRLAEIDAQGIGVSRAQYEALAATLAELPAQPQLSRLVQVDLTKPAPELTLGAAFVAELASAVQTLHAFAPTPRQDALARFREQFTRRYETREVPLVEVLDEEHGIGFDLLGPQDAEPQPASVHSARDRLLLRKLADALAAGVQEIEIDPREIGALDLPEQRRLPEGFEVLAALEADSAAAADTGDFRLLVHSVSGPPGARLSARFCHADSVMHEYVAAQLRAEEASSPDSVFAEIVHLPEDRVGNILSRPLLRAYEIPYLGVSAAPPDRQLPVTDLLVSVEGDQIVLRSRRLGREVVPRLTTAHNFALNSLAVYRFLAALQHQAVTPALLWDWGELAHAPFLPRVVTGRTVVSRARWNLAAAEIAVLSAASENAESYQAAHALRRRRSLPRFVALADGDNELVVDLDNVLSLEALARELRNRTAAALVELFPDPERLCVQGPEGRFVHQLVVPFLNEVPAPATPSPRRRRGTSGSRRFAPGSEWLYLKLFSGSASTDLVLDQVAHGVVTALEAGIADRWFFIRYGDPDWHLRLRIRGNPGRLLSETLPHLHALAQPLLDRGLLWRVQLDTYEREVERYGGDDGIDLSERFFHADSEAVLALVRALAADSEARWQAALAGIYLLFDDFGLTLDEKRSIVHHACQGYGREFGITKEFQAEMSRRYRRERGAIEALLNGADPPPFVAPLRARSAALEPVADALRRLADIDELSQPLPEIVMSYAHMHVNRLLRTSQRAHELVLYEMLSRIYSSEMARSRAVQR